MGGESNYEIHQNAYIKLILHALKHKTSSVNGVLLGRISGNGDNVEIVESVPLFHSQIGLLPPLEISLIMVSSPPFELKWILVAQLKYTNCFDNEIEH